MGKVSSDDKLRIQTLHEQGLGYHAIAAKYLEKNWKLDTFKLICKRVDKTGSALISFELLASCDSLKCQISMFRLISIQAL